MMHACVGEFLGTLLLVLLGNGGVANMVLQDTKAQGAGWLAITFSWGMAVFVAVWCVADMSGAHINPAVTVGLAAAGKFPWYKVAGYIAAQLFGAIAGATLVYLFYRDHYAVTNDSNLILGTFATAPAIRRFSSNLLSEMLGTLVLVLAVLLAVEPEIMATGFAAAMTNETPQMTIGLGTLGALPVGLLVLCIGLCLGGTTGYAINPARDFGPRIAHALLPIPGKGTSDWPYAWVPVVGPIIGALLAALIYNLVRISTDSAL